MKENEIQVLGYSPKRENLRRYWPLMAVAAVALLIIGILIGRFAIREPRTIERQLGESTIDTCLQMTTDSLLRSKMEEINAMSGQAIVMEVSTGEICALVGLQRRFDGEFESCRNFGHQQESGLMRSVSALALLDTEKIKPDSRIETGSGVYLFGDRVIKDHNWHRGGYGILNFDEVILFASNIGISRFVENIYGRNPQAFFDKLNDMSLGQPDSIDGMPELKPMLYTSPQDSCWTYAKLGFHAIGYERLIAPIQILTFYNAIANDGRMMKPMLYHGDSIVINPQIAKLKHIREMQAILRSAITEGLGMKAETKMTEVSGCTGTSQVASGRSEDLNYDDNEYCVQFCGYFPAQRPQYSIIVSLNKIGLPASAGGMAGPVFRQIVEYMVERGM